MEQQLRDKLYKVYQLVNKGATEGERQAARKALDRIVEKHNISAHDLDNIATDKYLFKYCTELELRLLEQIMQVIIKDGISRSKRKPWSKEIESELEYQEWVTVECAYEYFRRHMKKEWNRLCAPELKKARKPKTKNAKRKYLQRLFFSAYIIKSELHLPEQITLVEVKSKKEMASREVMKGVEGGKYNRQIITNNLLDY